MRTIRRRPPPMDRDRATRLLRRLVTRRDAAVRAADAAADYARRLDDKVLATVRAMDAHR